MVNEPYVDPPRPPTEEQRRMLIEAGRDFDKWGTQRYTSETLRYAGPVVYAEGGLLVWKQVHDLYAVSLDWDQTQELVQPLFYDSNLWPPNIPAEMAERIWNREPDTIEMWAQVENLVLRQAAAIREAAALDIANNTEPYWFHWPQWTDAAQHRILKYMAGLYESGLPGPDFLRINEQLKAVGVRSVDELFYREYISGHGKSDWVYMDFNHGETAILALSVWLDYAASVRRSEDMATTGSGTARTKYASEDLVQGAVLYGPNRWHRPVVPGYFSGYGTQWAQLRYDPGEEWNYAWIMEPDTSSLDTLASIPRKYEIPMAALAGRTTWQDDFIPKALGPADHQIFPSRTSAELNHSSRIVWGWVPFENINAMSRMAAAPRPSHLWADRVFVVHETYPKLLKIAMASHPLAYQQTHSAHEFVPSDGDARSFMPLTEYLVNLGLMADNNG